jgi:predicted amidohydrolase YtcJ
MKRLLCFTVCVALVAAACVRKDDKATTVFRSGAVYTVDKNMPWAEAVAILDNIIIYVGPDDGVQSYIGPETEVVDLAGKMLMPGFHDVHMHPNSASVFVYECNLYGLYTKEELVDRLKECAAQDSDSPWLRGTGWEASTPDSPEQLFKEDLDKIAPDRPVYLMDLDGHHAVVNSKALEIVGIDASTEDPAGGIIHRRAGGEPSGLLIETAAYVPESYAPEVSFEDSLKTLQFAMRKANEYGITTINDAWEPPERDGVWKHLREQGLLTARVNLSLLVTETWDEDWDALLARKLDGDEMLSAMQVKLLVDGVMENQTAAVKRPYLGTDGNKGLSMFTDEQLNKWIPLFEKHGFQVHAHTIGDAAVDQVLTALEASREINGAPNDRPFLIHCYLIDPADYPRIEAAGATVNFTMLWRQYSESIASLVEPYLTEEQFERLMPMADAHDHGLVVTGASDWLVSQMDPLASVAAALTGKAVPYYRDEPYDPAAQPEMPGKKPSLETMLAAYTINGAYASHMESFTGSIEVGKRADLIVLEKNLFEIPAEQIYGTKVLMTMLDGKVVYALMTILDGKAVYGTLGGSPAGAGE